MRLYIDTINKYARESAGDPELQDDADQWKSTAQIVANVYANRFMKREEAYKALQNGVDDLIKRSAV